jgi:membrane protein DedA with SNARE-associated domain
MDIGGTFEHIVDAVRLFFENVSLNDLIKRHGAWFYLITFVWAFLEGETFVIFAGAAAAQGSLNIYHLIFFAWIGSFCGDQTYFFLGRKFGKKLITKFPKLQPGSEKVSKLIQKYDIAFILTYRYLYGLRNVASVCMGISNLEWRKFMFWNFIAAFIWANSFAWAGYIFGEVLDKVLGDTIEGIMIGLVVLVAIILIAKYVHKKFEQAKMRKEALLEQARAAEAQIVEEKQP